jgi:hypothetical protein
MNALVMAPVYAAAISAVVMVGSWYVEKVNIHKLHAFVQVLSATSTIVLALSLYSMHFINTYGLAIK